MEALEPMAKMHFSGGVIRNAERWVIGLVALTIVLTLLGVAATSSQSFAEHWATFPWGAVGILAAATVVESVLRFWRYHTSCKALGLSIPFWRLMYYYTVGYALLPTPGKVGTVIRLWLLQAYHGIPYRRSAPLMVMDFVSDAIAMLALGGLALMVVDHPTMQNLGWVVMIALGLGVMAVVVAPWVLEAMVGALYVAAGKRRARLFSRLRGVVRGSAKLGGRILFITSTQCFVGWALVGAAVAHLLTAMGAPLTMAEGSIVVGIGTMGGFLSMMPAGVGGAEATMGFLLAQFGVPLATIVIAVALIRLCGLWLTVLVGLVLVPFALRGAPKRLSQKSKFAEPSRAG
ncbi:MAG: YbhN family protein [bacterium]